jgi:transposase-like protein
MQPQRPAQPRFPYVFLDATYCKARVDHRVVSQAVVVATGVAADGHREVLGFDVGDSKDGAFWTSFLRSLCTRGLTGVQLVISDAHAVGAEAQHVTENETARCVGGRCRTAATNTSKITSLAS